MKFLVSGTDRRGKRVTERVEAESGDAAVESVRDRLSDVRLETDSVVGAIGGTTSEEHRSGLETLYSAEDEAALGSRSGLWFQLRVLYRFLWFLWLPALALLVWRRAAAWPWSWVDVLLLVVPLAPLPLVFASRRRTSVYDGLLRAAAMCRWQEVLDLLPATEKVLRSPGVDFGEQEISARRAEALAGLGRTAEAEAEMERLRGLEVLPEPLFWLRFGMVYEAARDFDAVERCYRRACELAPEDTVARLSLAELLVRRRRDAAGAETELKAARRHEIAETSTWAVDRLEGMIALERGDARGARDALQKAVGEVSKQVTGPLTPFVIQDLCAYLALAAAELGDTASAKAYFQAAQPLLAAHQETELIERCRAALGELDG